MQPLPCSLLARAKIWESAARSGMGLPKVKKYLAIAGGVGAAPLLPLARADCVMTLLLGAKTESELLFVDQLDECTDVLIATDDGSLGQHGFVTALMDDLNLGVYDRIAVCGPETMMRTVLAKVEEKGIAHKTEFSLHRYMKCGVRHLWFVLHRSIRAPGLQGWSGVFRRSTP